MLKNERNLTEKQYIKFEEIMASNLKTAEAWSYAETFKTVLDSSLEVQAYAYFGKQSKSINFNSYEECS